MKVNYFSITVKAFLISLLLMFFLIGAVRNLCERFF